MKNQDWKEYVIHGLGGLLVFFVAGYAAVIDIVSYTAGRPLIIYARNSSHNDLGIFLTLLLIMFSVLGLLSFALQVHRAYKKRTRPPQED